MWELFQYCVGILCLLLGLGGGGGALVISQDARTPEFATGTIVIGCCWAFGMGYLAFRLFGLA